VGQGPPSGFGDSHHYFRLFAVSATFHVLLLPL
jgi:hypothetical protein